MAGLLSIWALISLGLLHLILNIKFQTKGPDTWKSLALTCVPTYEPPTPGVFFTQRGFFGCVCVCVKHRCVQRVLRFLVFAANLAALWLLSLALQFLYNEHVVYRAHWICKHCLCTFFSSLTNLDHPILTSIVLLFSRGMGLLHC